MSLNKEQKWFVRQRAGNCCEYCRLSQMVQLVRFQVDHILAIKYGGADTHENLCLACYDCNSYKGSNVAAIDPLTHQATKLYHPRQQVWEDHFEIYPDATLLGLTPEGRVTILALRMNDEERVQQRWSDLTNGDYPC